MTFLKIFFSQANQKGLINISSPEKYADHIISMLKGQYYTEILFGIKDKILEKDLQKHLDSLFKILNI